MDSRNNYFNCCLYKINTFRFLYIFLCLIQDKLWSTVTTPSKEAKKHHGSTATTCIESPGGPMAVRNTVFRQLGYFVFSDGQVDRKQFTLNKVFT